MHWFLDPITKHYADFEGRVGRQEYWMFVLFAILIQIAFYIIAFDIIGLDIVSMLVSLGLLVPSIAIGARRLHDIDKSGWWQLLAFIPIVGWIILIVWHATKTDPVDNQYGEPARPKMDSAPAVATAPVVTTSDVPPVEEKADVQN